MGSCLSSRVNNKSSGLYDLHLSRYQSSSAASQKREGEILSKANVKSFTFNDLKLATKNFRADTVVGEGGFGSVYRGWFDETTLGPTKSSTGLVIAVKRLNPGGFQGHREWLVRHNIVFVISNTISNFQFLNFDMLFLFCCKSRQRSIT